MCYWQNHEILVMDLLRNKPLTIILSCICYVSRNCYANASNDSDDDSLKEALLLVDILKTEYIKALRENVAGIYRADNNNTILSDDQATCAPTTEGETYNLSTISEKLNEEAISQIPRHNRRNAPQWSTTPLPQTLSGPPPLAKLAQPQGLYSSAAILASKTPSPDIPLYGENLQHPYRTFRRRIPIDYYYYFDQRWNPESDHRFKPRYDQHFKPEYDHHFKPMVYESPLRYNFPVYSRRKNVDEESKLRFNYNVPLGAYPFTTAATTPDVSIISTTAEPRLTTKTSKAAFSSELRSKISSTYASNTPTKTNMKNKNKLKLNAYTPIKSYRKKMDPVQDQVAAELADELKNAEEPKSSNKENIPTMPTTPIIRKRSTKKNVNLYKKNDEDFLNTIKTTLRVHLERSTRIPIPFPENNPFCFTNPESALCRTLL